MSVLINTNISALSTSRLLGESTDQLSKSLKRLSSGSKLVSPGDDVAGMAVSMKFDAQINRSAAARTNAGNAISFAQTQDGFLGKVKNALDRMGELAVLAQDETKTNSDRALYDKEFQTLDDYITDISSKEFNGVSLFDGQARGITIDSDANTFSMAGVNMGSANYTGVRTTAVATTSGAASALTAVKTAITQLSTDRATVGANISRLEHTTDQLQMLEQNLSASNSRIRDVDVAEESTRFARYNILVQSGTAMLAQANTLPQSALRLLG